MARSRRRAAPGAGDRGGCRAARVRRLPVFGLRQRAGSACAPAGAPAHRAGAPLHAREPAHVSAVG